MIRFRFRQHPIPRGVLPNFFGLNDTGFLTQNSLVIPFRTTYEGPLKISHPPFLE